MSLESPEARLAWLQKIAATFPGERWIKMNLVWENQHGSAGVTIDDTGAWVFLNNSFEVVSSLEQAVHVLRGIFADEIVAVTAYSKDLPVRQCLGPATDPSIGFNTMDTPASGDMPVVDYVAIENWSSGLQEEE